MPVIRVSTPVWKSKVFPSPAAFSLLPQKDINPRLLIAAIRVPGLYPTQYRYAVKRDEFLSLIKASIANRVKHIIQSVLFKTCIPLFCMTNLYGCTHASQLKTLNLCPGIEVEHGQLNFPRFETVHILSLWSFCQFCVFIIRASQGFRFSLILLTMPVLIFPIFCKACHWQQYLYMLVKGWGSWIP